MNPISDKRIKDAILWRMGLLPSGFKITRQSLMNLMAERLSETVLAALRLIVDQEFEGEKQFLARIQNMIGGRLTMRDESVILKYAPLGSREEKARREEAKRDWQAILGWLNKNPEQARKLAVEMIDPLIDTVECALTEHPKFAKSTRDRWGNLRQFILQQGELPNMMVSRITQVIRENVFQPPVPTPQTKRPPQNPPPVPNPRPPSSPNPRPPSGSSPGGASPTAPATGQPPA